MNSIVTIKDLSIQINSLPLVQNISFNINAGDAILLSGANGIGKSTILKSILCLETDKKKINGSIVVNGFDNILALGDDELQRFRSSVAYVPQRDDFAVMGNIRVRDIISESHQAFTGKMLTDSEVNELIDEWIPRKEDNHRVFDAKSKPGKFSGGQQRLLSVLSVIATRPKSGLFIIDEPLNNLDFANARNISNIINKVIKENPQMGLLMVSHCRIFPFITRELELTHNGINEVPNHYACHSCFGRPDNDGYYR